MQYVICERFPDILAKPANITDDGKLLVSPIPKEWGGHCTFKVKISISGAILGYPGHTGHTGRKFSFERSTEMKYTDPFSPSVGGGWSLV